MSMKAVVLIEKLKRLLEDMGVDDAEVTGEYQDIVRAVMGDYSEGETPFIMLEDR